MSTVDVPCPKNSAVVSRVTRENTGIPPASDYYYNPF
jgi:hypothetical protein